MFKAVLFDMDGVIVDTEPLHRKAHFQTFQDLNIQVSDKFYNSLIGQTTFSICQTVVEHFKLPLSPYTVMDIKRDHYKALFDTSKSLTLMDGVLDLIKDYHANGLQLVVASSSTMENINLIFNRFNLNPYFKGKVSGAELEASKPHPEIFMKAADVAGHAIEDCFVIEDSSNGIIAAKEAKAFCVAFKGPHSLAQDYSRADRVVESFSDIKFNNLKQLFSLI
ncbi:HAD family hydrolase [Psychroserpens sp. XS_ASV72]|uniref:HAD family hydrolase n=1 Tax=Psychroserpens sp. XS_ASV72 TaxID=3241293 RepID=UPI00351110B8